MIDSLVLHVPIDRVEGTIISRGQSGWHVAAMTTITFWQPLPNVPVETVLIVFQKEAS